MNDGINSISLTEFNNQVKQVLEGAFASAYWVHAEILTLNVNAISRHCYLELIEKDDKTEQIAAKIKAAIWSYKFKLIKEYFETTTGMPLRSGIVVSVCVSVSFHPVHGLSLVVEDIDPMYTVGSLYLQRQNTLKRLKEEGLLELNASLAMPLLPKRIAVVSSATAAGFGDFKNELENNGYGFGYNITLFDTIMQGDKAEQSLIDSLLNIAESALDYDLVVIVRGGGATSDLSCFDAYSVAALVAQMPLPVVVGVGHERDFSVLDTVAAVRQKTPTAVARFIIDLTLKTAARLQELEQSIYAAAKDKLQRDSAFFDKTTALIPLYATTCLNKEKRTVDRLALDRQWLFVKSILDKNKFKIQKYANVVALSSIDNVLKRGFSLTLRNGVLVGTKDIQPGDMLTTQFHDGIVESQVFEKK